MRIVAIAKADISAEQLLNIYKSGLFPMAESAEECDMDICQPTMRSILPIETLHVSKSLRKKVLREEFQIRINTSFPEVVDACAAFTDSRHVTWINSSIKRLFNQLHDMGHAHSVEAWKDGHLVGGLYGLQIGSAFCGESMFSRTADASKAALVHLCARLSATGFTLLDSQLPNPHLDQFGQDMIPQQEYMKRLEAALKNDRNFLSVAVTEKELVHRYLSPN
ncbi:MAG: leucyl/phenylalanyl-tRNA--protein transferase [Micavibrio aeruginosavorus]|uniref:Leucyl/phenylalanyl-tRNA--protein transferase n=1 Tax=Micavibrio aeruginosavorus TaxID=349221 RepID=A0A2W5HNM9_9BACT|nr:MAG: leucyl/phenylalanyl-tRNA--protein transferase [Micavibrio aeruginosavorus]